MIKRTIYAWLERGQFRVSLFPPDAPVRPSVALDSKQDVLAMAEKKRARIVWWPVLPHGV